MSGGRLSGLRATAGGLLAVGVLLAGCGSASVEQAVAPAAPDTPLKTSPPAGEPKCGNIRYEGDDAPYWRKYADWLRTSKIKKLDPKTLQGIDSSDVFDAGPPQFDYAAEKADLVVSGTVTDLLLVPDGVLATFQVDRAAKGEKVASIYVMQAARVAPESPISNESAPQLIVDPVDGILLKHDRAVLFLTKRELSDLNPAQGEFIGDSLGCAPIYRVIRGSGQYPIKEGKVQEHKSDSSVSEKRFDGKSERELMDAAEARAKEPKQYQ